MTLKDGLEDKVEESTSDSKREKTEMGNRIKDKKTEEKEKVEQRKSSK